MSPCWLSEVSPVKHIFRENRRSWKHRLPYMVERLFYTCLVFLFIVNTAYGAPDVPLNFDGWITEALAKLETNGITGGFHRQTAPLSRAEIVEIVAQAESRIQAGVVVVSAI